MALAKFNKIAIYGLQNERERLVKLLQDCQLMEITGFTTDDKSSDSPEFQKIISGIKESSVKLDRKISEISRALSFLEHYAPVKPNLIQQFAGIKTYLTPEEFEQLLADEGHLQKSLTDLSGIEQELNRIQTKRAQYQTLLDNLLPWRNLDLTYADLQGSESVRVLLGSLNNSLMELEAGLSELKLPFYLEKVSDENNQTLFLLIARIDSLDSIQGVLSRFSVNLVTLPPFETTVQSQIDDIYREYAKLELEECKAKEQIVSLTAERTVLQVFYDAWSNERDRLEIIQQFGHQERSFALFGWVNSDKMAILKEKLTNSGLKYVLTEAEIDADEQPPTEFRNTELVAPFEYLVKNFSLPKTDEVDPTPAIAPFFFIFFGIALGDAGYGLLLALISVGLMLKIKMRPEGKRLSWMFLICGIGTIVIGLLTGSVLSLQNIKFGIFNPMENPILLLLIALGLGLAQLYFGVLISAWPDVKAGRWGNVFWNQGMWLFFLTSVLLILAKDYVGLSAYSNMLLYAFLAAVIGLGIAKSREKKDIVGKLLAIPLGGLGGIYGSIGFFSDVLSYSRLMALGLSGGVMGGIMNQLAGMVFNSVPVIGWIFGIAIFLFGHILNFALCVLGAYVHSSRLQFLEFFGKFYEGGGRPFLPFGHKLKYIFLINKREA